MAWYGHLKRGSVTPKVVGAPVAAGEYLGTGGRFGNSTGPHLHFELDAARKLTHPHARGRQRPAGPLYHSAPATARPRVHSGGARNIKKKKK